MGLNKSINDFQNMLLHDYNIKKRIKSKTISAKNDFKPWIDQSMKNQMKTRQNYSLLYGNMAKCQNQNIIILYILWQTQFDYVKNIVSLKYWMNSNSTWK